MGDFVVNTLSQTLGNFVNLVGHFLPHLLAMLIIIVLGLLIALVIKMIVQGILKLAQFSNYSDRTGLTEVMKKAALPSPTESLARLTFWLVWFVFIVLGINALGITVLQDQISRFFSFIPQLLVALFVILVGLLAANFFGRATLLAATNADYPSARFLSGLVRLLITLLAITMALEQVGLGRHVVLIAFSIAFGAIMLGTAIAFGLGGRDLARRVLEKQFPEKGHEKGEDISPL